MSERLGFTGKRILMVSCDGTGQAAGTAVNPTNVWLLHDSVHARYEMVPGNTLAEVRKLYLPGIGTKGPGFVRKFAGLFGWGLTKAVTDGYLHLCRNWRDEEGDGIYLFGYSRGAYAVRVLASIVAGFGLVNSGYLSSCSPRHRRRLVRSILRAYRSTNAEWPEYFSERRGVLSRKRGDRPRVYRPDIDFVGVFDTVDSVGVPLPWLEKIIDRAYGMLTKHRLWSFHDRKLHERVKYGAQALALDDERLAFTPNVWDEAENVKQVWFAGSHSSVGGGGARPELSRIPLDWMARTAMSRGLPVSLTKLEACSRPGDPCGEALDSRHDLMGKIQSFARRDVPEGANVHVSVLQRMEGTGFQYAPRSLLPTGDQWILSHDRHGGFSSKHLRDMPRWRMSNRVGKADWKPAGFSSKEKRIWAHKAIQFQTLVLAAVSVNAAAAFAKAGSQPADGLLASAIQSFSEPLPWWAADVLAFAGAHPLAVGLLALHGAGLWAVRRWVTSLCREAASMAWISVHAEASPVSWTSSNRVHGQLRMARWALNGLAAVGLGAAVWVAKALLGL